MKAAFLNGPKEVELKDVEKPEISGGEILLKNLCSAVCSTDIKIWSGKKKVDYLEFPVVLGHEVVGAVEEKGDDHTRFEEGDRLVFLPGASCGECEQCLRGRRNLCQGGRDVIGYNLNGGFAEYVRLPESMFDNNRCRVHKISDGTPLKRAVLFEPLSCAWNGVFRRSKVQPGDTVLIVGLGVMGLLNGMLSLMAGAGKVIGCDPIEERREKAGNIGIETVVDPTKDGYEDELLKLTGGFDADEVIASLGSPRVFEEYLQFVKDGGNINLFGGAPYGSEISISPNVVHYGEIDVVGTSGYRFQDTGKILDTLESGRIKAEELVTSSYSLKNIEDALSAVNENKDIKAVIDFAGER